MIRSLYRTQDEHFRINLTPDELTTALQDASGLLWVDFVDELVDVCEPILRQTFGFHPLAVADALQESHVPKVDDWGQYLYLVLHAAALDQQNGAYLDTLELDVFLGRNYVVTYHSQPIVAVDRVWTTCQREERHLREGPDHLLYKLASELIAGYVQVVEGMDTAVEQIEEEIFTRPTPATLGNILMLKRALLHLGRIINPQREVLSKLAHDDYSVIDPKDRVFFGDVYDHLVRLCDINGNMRELVAATVDTYLSIMDHRMNDVMGMLTVITSLFMPASFVAGFFGMNFFQAAVPMSAWTSPGGFLLMMAAMLATPVSMYLWIRRRLRG